MNLANLSPTEALVFGLVWQHLDGHHNGRFEEVYAMGTFLLTLPSGLPHEEGTPFSHTLREILVSLTNKGLLTYHVTSFTGSYWTLAHPRTKQT